MVVNNDQLLIVPQGLSDTPLGSPAIDGPHPMLLADHLLNLTPSEASLAGTFLGMLGPDKPLDTRIGPAIRCLSWSALGR